MGYIPCDACGEDITGHVLDDTEHACDLEVVKQRLARFEKRANTAEREADDLRGAIMHILYDWAEIREANRISADTAPVSMARIRQLWTAAGCRHYDEKTPELHISRWLKFHKVLCSAMRLFKSKTRHGYKMSELLTHLRDDVMLACGKPEPEWPFDRTVEELVSEIQRS